MTYRVELRSHALRDLRRLPDGVRALLAERIDALALNPRPAGVEKLSGGERLYRVRMGDYRIVYEIQDSVLVVLVVRVGHRREIYRGRG